MSNIIYRLYETHDFENGLFDVLHQGFGSNVNKEFFEKGYVGNDRNITIAFDKEKAIVVGYLSWEIHVDYVKAKKIMFATYIAVNPAYRGRGVATRLFSELEATSRSLKCNSIEFTSANFRTDAHRLYKHIGFSVKETTVFIKEIEYLS